MSSTPSSEGLSAGLTVFFRSQQVQVHDVVESEEACYTVWVQGNPRQVHRVVELLPALPQIVAYRHHPTSEGVVELYALGAEFPAQRGINIIYRSRSGKHDCCPSVPEVDAHVEFDC